MNGYQLLYRLGIRPWESAGLPAELKAAVAGRTGRALELGCGRGRQAMEVARLGWQVTAVDITPAAIEAAHAAAADVDFQVADVTDLAGIEGPFDLAYDIKCFHGLAPERRAAYVAALAERLRPGAEVLLYATEPSRLRARLGLPGGVSLAEVSECFAPAFELVGSRTAPREPFGTAFYRLRRRVLDLRRDLP